MSDLKKLVGIGAVLAGAMLAARAEVNPEMAAHIEALQKEGRIAEAVAALEAEAKRDPKDSEIFNGLGNLRLALGHAKVARAYYEKAVMLAPNRADYWSNLGVLEAKIDNPKGALEALDRALKIDPNHRASLLNAGDVLFERGKFPLAEAYYDRLLKAKPQDSVAHFRKALARRAQGDSAGAAKAAGEAVRLDPEFVDARAELGFIYMDLNEHEKALRHFQVLNAKLPDFVRARYGAAMCWRELKKYDEAIEQFQWAVVLAPETADYRVDLAFAFLRSKKPGSVAEAEQALLRGLEAQPDSQRANFMAGVFYDELGKWEHAAHYYSQAVALGHPNPRAKLFLAQDFLKLGKKGAANALLFDLMAKLPPEDSVHKEALKLLSSKS